MLWQTEFEDTMTFNVLSLFDGMSCGQIALNRAGIKYDTYFASEVDEHTIKVAQHNYPDTIQIGDITELDGTKLPKIDLLIGGSPCQSFSKTVSNNKGFSGKSKLFFEFVRLLEECKPKYFLLENVVMKKEWNAIISEHLHTDPIPLDSCLFSAQSRARLYWTNIPFDRIVPSSNEDVLEDVLEVGVDKKYSYKESFEFHGGNKVVCATLNINGHDIIKRVNSSSHKCQTLTAVCGGNHQKKVIQQDRVRKLTPVEYERLQTVPDGYTGCVSDSQRYKMLGNGFTVDAIAHILKNIKNNPKPKGRQQLGLLSCDDVVPLLMTKIM